MIQAQDITRFEAARVLVALDRLDRYLSKRQPADWGFDQIKWEWPTNEEGT